MSEEPNNNQPWWGEFELAEGETHFWRIGPMEAWVHRDAREWRIALRGHDDYLENALEIDRITGDEIFETEAPKGTGTLTGIDLRVLRYAFRKTSPGFTIKPALATRPVVANPVSPVFLAHGEEVTFYVSTPLWLEVRSRQPGVKLCDEPTYRPSDTWFGPSTRVGELCFATRTAARLRPLLVPRRPHRATTAVTIRNRAESPLSIERLNLPMPGLSVFATEDGAIWTEAVTLTRGSEHDEAEMTLSKSPPQSAGAARKLGGPRAPVAKGHLFRAFSGIFG